MTGTGQDNSTIVDRSLFQHFLQPGERVIWSGRPGRLRWIGADNWRHIINIFALLWLLPSGFVVLFILKFLVQDGWSGVSTHWFLLVLLVGISGVSFTAILMLINRRIARLRRTSYVLKDRRAVIVEQRNKPRPTSVALDLVNRFGTDIRRDGSGDLAFGYRREDVNEVGWAEKPRLTFEDISDVPRVLSLAQEALAKMGYQPVS
jgi:hypothetical protein